MINTHCPVCGTPCTRLKCPRCRHAWNISHELQRRRYKRWRIIPRDRLPVMTREQFEFHSEEWVRLAQVCGYVGERDRWLMV